MLQDYKDKHRGETCLIIGNGPSLEKTPLKELCAKYVSFGANKIYGLVTPTYWTCVDVDMLHDCGEWVIKHPGWKPEARFVTRGFPLPGSEQLNVVIAQGFSTDAAKAVIIGGTVTYVNMQLAYYMGFTTALLVGLDHKYPKTSKGRPGSKFIASGDDPDHFRMPDGSPYFAPGKIYNRPELDAVAKYTYPTAWNAYTAGGRSIVNLTPDSALHAYGLFEKGTFDEWL